MNKIALLLRSRLPHSSGVLSLRFACTVSSTFTQNSSFRPLPWRPFLYDLRRFSNSAKVSAIVDDDCVQCSSDCACNEETECWKCNRVIKKCSFFCSNNGCSAIQKINTDDDCSYFELFNMHPKFDIDRVELEVKFKEAQKLLHPDKYAVKSKIEKEASASCSSVVNQAYQVLSNPLERAGYMLSMKGITVLDEDQTDAMAGLSDHAQSYYQRLMLEMFALREDIDEVNSRAELNAIISGISERIQLCSSDLQKAWNENDRNGLIMAGVSIKYFYKALENAMRKEEGEFPDDKEGAARDVSTECSDSTIFEGSIDRIDFKIHRVGSEILRKPCASVSADALLTNEIQQVMLEAHAALKDFRQKNGFGRAIAAPQVGYNVQMIALNMPNITANVKSTNAADVSMFNTRPFSMFNPKIVSKSDDTFTMWDDCLSFPDLMCCVERSLSIDISFMDESGKTHLWCGCNQLLSELLQHEVDHLNGILAVDIAINPNKTDKYVDAVIKRSDWLENKEKYNNMVDYAI